MASATMATATIGGSPDETQCTQSAQGKSRRRGEGRHDLPCPHRHRWRRHRHVLDHQRGGLRSRTQDRRRGLGGHQGLRRDGRQVKSLDRIAAVLLTVAAMAAPARAEDPVRLHAAGSLRPALTEVAAAFEATTGAKVQSKFGPSGVLKDEIVAGAAADVFASANMEHPQALAQAKRAGPVVLFARNRLCALARPGLDVTTANVLATILDPKVKLGTSTPRNDPAGDYAWEVFHKADALKPGAFGTLENKALQLVGGPTAPSVPPGRSVYAMLLAEGKA